MANPAAGALVFDRGLAVQPQAWIDFVGPAGDIFSLLSGSPHEAGKMNRTAAFVGVPLEGIFYGGQDFESALEEEG
jgi:hypothetical protein